MPPVEAVVAGLGAMGSAVTYHLARRGLRVLGIDQLDPPHSQGSSHGGSRIIRKAYFEHAQYVPLVRRAELLWSKLETASGISLLHRAGAVMVGPEDGKLLRGAAESARLHDIPHEVMDRSDASRRFPFLKIPDQYQLLHEPGAGVLAPERCIAAHLEQARLRGAELQTGVRVTGWRSGPETVVVGTDRGEVTTRHLVLCAGAWLPSLLPQLPLKVERQVMLWFAAATRRGSPIPPGGPSFLWETAEGELYYGIAESEGILKAARHHGGDISPIAEIDRKVRPADIEPVRRFLEQHVPAAAGQLLRGAVCSYTNTPDEHFLIAPLETEPLVHVVSACSGHGFKFASAIGEAIARRVRAEDDAVDLSAFGLERLR